MEGIKFILKFSLLFSKFKDRWKITPKSVEIRWADLTVKPSQKTKTNPCYFYFWQNLTILLDYQLMMLSMKNIFSKGRDHPCSDTTTSNLLWPGRLFSSKFGKIFLLHQWIYHHTGLQSPRERKSEAKMQLNHPMVIKCQNSLNTP